MNYCHPHKFAPMWHSAEHFAPWCLVGSCCSMMRLIMSNTDPHLVFTSAFSLCFGRFCSSASSLLLFQLYDNEETIYLHTCNTRSTLPSARPFWIAKSRLWPKQFNHRQFKSSQAKTILLPLSVVSATSLVIQLPVAQCWSQSILESHTSMIFRHEVSL